MGQLERTTNFFCFCMRLCLLGIAQTKWISQTKDFSNLLPSSGCAKKSKPLSKRKWKNVFEMIIIISLTTNYCIAAVQFDCTCWLLTLILFNSFFPSGWNMWGMAYEKWQTKDDSSKAKRDITLNTTWLYQLSQKMFVSYWNLLKSLHKNSNLSSWNCFDKVSPSINLLCLRKAKSSVSLSMKTSLRTNVL